MAADLRCRTALTEIILPVPAGCCTGSCDDPEVLSFLQHPGAEYHQAAGG
jgi:hypothetical protein